MALIVLIYKITKALENGDYVIGMFLDFSKAFDTVNHHMMLEKLEYYGIRWSALAWFESYLANRQQYVTYNEVKSSCKTIKCDVPQGSILGPLLFLLYINDLANICKHTLPVLFADDTNLFNSGKDLTELHAKSKAISTWLKVNKLSLNVKKTHQPKIASPRHQYLYWRSFDWQSLLYKISGSVHRWKTELETPYQLCIWENLKWYWSHIKSSKVTESWFSNYVISFIHISILYLL